MIPGGGSVATSAFSLALRWRCDPIIFLGLDLSFPGGQYYVATSSDGAARAEVDAKGLMRGTGQIYNNLSSQAAQRSYPC